MADTDVTRDSHPAHPLLVNDAASAWLGIQVLETGGGRARISMLLRPEMVNGFGIGHGGMVFAFADTAFALACNPEAGGPAVQRENITVAAGADITFLAPVQVGELLTAAAEHRAGNGRSGVYDIEVRSERPDGTSDVVALFRGRSRTMRNPARPAAVPAGSRA
ncbi:MULTISPECIES: hotdog fold thioesterase [unclassified Arthrobacter]|uniref:hotdog fold thioesterase n=1 Tax=unclassified Arthrobacter TaxID=235627 RepID=UPI001E4F536E|nr:MULTISPECIES: hotdog fold thioesterase [unclassified Arthrobacter]MCC9144764.1 hotdog fold thioesterase [Arthrobacter sp. zg-Y919]MDK1275990.1 hotdog fold thioesterase [Arthrobacter sp. zg.Y919]MDM7990146.1 hotdog fold thioesterase [Arthrobacter sp. zg-Y877]WIB02662.1 hotdog fold thioesterase [Arthrobacter sp. zg-Y919]